MDYSKVDADELKEEIYHRQMMGIPDVMPRISRISCRCCHEPIMSVSLHWKDHYKPRQAPTLFDVWSPTNINRSLFLGWWPWQGMEYVRKLLDNVQMWPEARI
jgi:hypothetical protein